MSKQSGPLPRHPESAPSSFPEASRRCPRATGFTIADPALHAVASEGADFWRAGLQSVGAPRLRAPATSTSAEHVPGPGLLWVRGALDHRIPSRREGRLCRRALVRPQSTCPAQAPVPAPPLGDRCRGARGTDRHTDRMPPVRSRAGTAIRGRRAARRLPHNRQVRVVAPSLVAYPGGGGMPIGTVPTAQPQPEASGYLVLLLCSSVNVGSGVSGGRFGLTTSSNHASC